jgi:hypothetical protein
VTDAETESALVTACRQFVNTWAPHAFLEVICQRGGRHSGTSRGAPDAFLYVSGRCLPIEFKSPTGRLSNWQETAWTERLKAGVGTYVVRDLQQFADLVTRERG